MTTTYLQLGGENRPVRYGFEALLAYEQSTGRNSVQDFASLQGGTVSVTLMVDLLYCGLVAGYRAENRTIDFDQFVVAGWLGSNVHVFEQAMAVFSSSFPSTSAADANAQQKKTTAQRKI